MPLRAGAPSRCDCSRAYTAHNECVCATSQEVNYREEERVIIEALYKSRKCFGITSMIGTRTSVVDVAALSDDERIGFHFSGHGRPAGDVALEGVDDVGEATGIASWVGRSEVAADLRARDVAPPVIACLMSCTSDMLAEALIRQVKVDHVVFTNKEVSGSLCVDFVLGFYTHLTAGRTVHKSFDFAKASLSKINKDAADSLVLGGASPTHNVCARA